jgi:hypothetical protein
MVNLFTQNPQYIVGNQKFERFAERRTMIVVATGWPKAKTTKRRPVSP